MTVKIEGMEMPKSCLDCKLCAYIESESYNADYYICQPRQKFLGDVETNKLAHLRDNGCPLQEVKE